MPSKTVAICNDKSNSVLIIFKPKKAILKINNEKQIFNEDHADTNSLFEAISEAILNKISQPL